MNNEFIGQEFSFGNITVGDLIGQGGFGEVYEAKINNINFNFAIKILNPSPFQSSSSKSFMRFLQEAEILFKIRHKYIIPIYGLGEIEGRPYILMERFQGHNLVKARERSSSKITPEIILPFIQRIAEALIYAHSTGIVHRDIKPTNLMTARNDARLLDFGIAINLDPNRERLTNASGVIGGDTFSAPELIENPKIIDVRSDIYSLGATWYWLLTGKAPKGIGIENYLRTTVKVAQDYERVILRCLNPIETRYLSTEELLIDLQALKIGQNPSVKSDDIEEKDALILGKIACQTLNEEDGATYFLIEREIGSKLSRLTIRFSIRKLFRLGLIYETDCREFDGSIFQGFRLTEGGLDWVEKNQKWVDSLLKEISEDKIEKIEIQKDEVPF